MKPFFVIITLVFLFVLSRQSLATDDGFGNHSASKKGPAQNAFFDDFKPYVVKDMALNDTLEFSVFDMADIEIVNDAPENKSSTGAPAGSLEEVKTKFSELPKFFYQALKAEIVRQKVPVTVFPDKSPEYSKPLSLYVKIKSIRLGAPSFKDGVSKTQPVSLRIYGQLKDKQTDEILFKYYDSVERSFIPKENQASPVLQAIASALMQDLAGYLRTNY